MICPYCKSENNIVISHYQTMDTKLDEFRRVRKCNNCGMTFATREIYSQKTLEEIEKLNKKQKPKPDESYQFKFYHGTKEAKDQAKENREKRRMSFTITPEDFKNCIEKCKGEDVDGYQNI